MTGTFRVRLRAPKPKSAKVAMISMPGHVTLDDTSREIVDMLRTTLAAAYTGRYAGLAVVMVANYSDPETDVFSAWKSSDGAPRTRVMASLDLIKAKIATA